MKDKKIIILDIDGTLVNSKKEITPETLKYLTMAQEQGHIVALASGRPYPGMKQYADALSLTEKGGYVLAFNGGMVIECATGRVVYEKAIANRYAGKLFEFAKKNHIGMVTYQDDKVITGTDFDDYMEFEARLNHMKLCKVDDFCDYVDFDMAKCLMTANPERAEVLEQELRELVGSDLNVFRSEPYFIEITTKGVDKAESVAGLLKLLSMEKEQCICCGDGFNDKTMVEYAGIGVAMGNAQDTVKEVADFITGTCDEDGIVEVVKRFVL